MIESIFLNFELTLLQPGVFIYELMSVGYNVSNNIGYIIIYIYWCGDIEVAHQIKLFDH